MIANNETLRDFPPFYYDLNPRIHASLDKHNLGAGFYSKSAANSEALWLIDRGVKLY